MDGTDLPHGEIHEVHDPAADLDSHREEHHLSKLAVRLAQRIEPSG